MSLMKQAVEDRTRLTVNLLAQFTKNAGFESALLSADYSTGTVDWEGVTFTASEGKLRMMGVCPKCTQDVASTPITRMADIADMLENFRPMKHHCMDI